MIDEGPVEPLDPDRLDTFRFKYPCPQCRTGNDGVTGNKQPVPGDIGICASCACITEVTHDGAPRMLTHLELMCLLRDAPHLHAPFAAVIKLIQAREGGDAS